LVKTTIPASISAPGAIIESIILQLLPIFAPLPIIEPLIWQLLSTTTSDSITEPLFIKQPLPICADGEIKLSPACFGVAEE